MERPGNLHIFIPGDPFPQPRVRSTAVGGHVRHYFKKSVGIWKRMAAGCARAILAGRDDWPEPYDGALLVTSSFYFECRKSRIRKTLQAPARFHRRKPDEDNLRKASLDALNGVVWTDDARIVQGHQEKIECRQGGIPGTVISVVPLFGLALIPTFGCALEHAQTMSPSIVVDSPSVDATS